VPYPPEEATLEHLRLLLQQLRPLLETRLVVMAQEVEHGLLESMVLHFARQRHGYLCWVLSNKTHLEIALRVCSSLAIDIKDLVQKEATTVRLQVSSRFLKSTVIRPRKGCCGGPKKMLIFFLIFLVTPLSKNLEVERLTFFRITALTDSDNL
jgi:hypothetical protein